MVDVWKAITGILGSILITGLVAWFAFGSDTVSRAQANELQIGGVRDRLVALEEAFHEQQLSLGRIESNLEHVRELLQEHKETHGR